MKTYYISVTETLNKIVEVHADSEQEALQKAEDSYYNDRVDTEFENDTESTLESYDNGGMPKFYEIQ
jgi:hypothetical protein